MLSKHIERFWSRVDKSSVNGCWIWLGAKGKSGHGVAWDGKKTRIAHRMAWFLTHGEYPPDCACHKCDNPPCCNPEHIFLGSRADNLADMRAKGRQAPMPRPNRKGELAPASVLSEAAVIRLLELHKNGEHRDVLAGMFGVSYSNVCAIVTGRSWGHLKRPGYVKDNRGERRAAAKRLRKNGKFTSHVPSQSLHSRQLVT